MKLVLHNSDGDVIREMPFGKTTRFDRVTASPETLADFIAGLPINVSPCEYIGCDNCMFGNRCSKDDFPDDKEVLVGWLKQEEDNG